MECDSGRLLVVDDDPENRETLFDLLSPQGYTVTLAENGERALEVADLTSCMSPPQQGTSMIITVMVFTPAWSTRAVSFCS